MIKIIFLTFSVFTQVGQASTNFAEMRARFGQAKPLDIDVLAGAFVGICDVNPILLNYDRSRGGYFVNEKYATVLVGRNFADGFRALMFIMYSTLNRYPDDLEKQISIYTEDYLKNKEKYFEALGNLKTASFKNGQVVVTFKNSEIGYRGYHEFRQSDGQIISGVFGGTKAPKPLQGIQSICFWFQRIE